MAFKYGRRAPKNAPALEFSTFAAAAPKAVPTHPMKEDYLATLTNWEVLGNDMAGDCNSVTWANMRRLVTSALATENYPDQDQVWEFYRTQNPDFDPTGTELTNGPESSADGGMDIQTGLEYLHSVGGPDGVKAVAFAKVNHRKKSEVEAALAIFGGLWLGIVVLHANQVEFDEHQSWRDVAHSPIAGRHAILAGGYTPDVKFITWGTETAFTSSFWNGAADDGSRLVEEAWVVIWPEHLGSETFLNGVDLDELKASYQALTGKALALAAPAPALEPEPALAP